MAVSNGELQEKLSAYLSLYFPSRRHAKVSGLMRITNGWGTGVFFFKIEREGGGKHLFDDLVLRMYQGDNAETKAAREFNAMAQLHNVGFPVPQVYLLEVDKSILGRSFMIMEKVNGRSMGELINESESMKGKMVKLFCR